MAPLEKKIQYQFGFKLQKGTWAQKTTLWPSFSLWSDALCRNDICELSSCKLWMSRIDDCFKLVQGDFFHWDPPKNHKFFSVRKFWYLELFWWDLLCNLTLRTFRGVPVKKITLYNSTFLYITYVSKKRMRVSYLNLLHRVASGKMFKALPARTSTRDQTTRESSTYYG